ITPITPMKERPRCFFPIRVIGAIRGLFIEWSVTALYMVRTELYLRDAAHSARIAESRHSRRNCRVSMLVELSVLIATLIGLLVGGFCIYWVKVRPSAR